MISNTKTKIKYIIVQAGGMGSRMERLTNNAPKALVPIRNLPMIFHLFNKYPDSHFIIIGDYKFDVLEKYLHEFATVNYELINSNGKKGTIAGLKDAVDIIPNDERFLLIWCDLVLPIEFEIPNSENDLIGISKDFICRWSYNEGKFYEEKSDGHGVAGFFVFNDKSKFRDLEYDGEFVRYLCDKNYVFDEVPLYKTHEYGLYKTWEDIKQDKCRPFNAVKIEGDKFYKIPIDDQGKSLAKREIAWYKIVKDNNFKNIPKIYNYDPLCLELIDGKNIYEYKDVDKYDKKNILKSIISCLKELHEIGNIDSDKESFKNAYIDKTFDRLNKVYNLVPFATDKEIIINGRTCRNVFYIKDELEKNVMKYLPDNFCFIHGDCTFSNIMLRKDMSPVLIDPRGYFGTTEIYGDVCYDWVKLYYSLFSNYDTFNLKQFDLEIGSNKIN